MNQRHWQFTKFCPNTLELYIFDRDNPWLYKCDCFIGLMGTGQSMTLCCQRAIVSNSIRYELFFGFTNQYNFIISNSISIKKNKTQYSQNKKVKKKKIVFTEKRIKTKYFQRRQQNTKL